MEDGFGAVGGVIIDGDDESVCMAFDGGYELHRGTCVHLVSEDL
jgi:hypothetical protein